MQIESKVSHYSTFFSPTFFYPYQIQIHTLTFFAVFHGFYSKIFKWVVIFFYFLFSKLLFLFPIFLFVFHVIPNLLYNLLLLLMPFWDTKFKMQGGIIQTVLDWFVLFHSPPCLK